MGGKVEPSSIGDTLIDVEQVKQSKLRFFIEAYDSYKRANSLLGYFSEIKDCRPEYERLYITVNDHRRTILLRYKDVMVSERPFIFKKILVLPTYTKWYNEGISKYKKVRNYSVYYYRRKLYIELEEDAELLRIKKILDAIIALDKYYDIYNETVEYMMNTSLKFDEIMRMHFSDCIYI